MISNKELSLRLFKATFAPDYETFDDLMFSMFRAMVAGAFGKSDRNLAASDFEMFLDLAGDHDRTRTVNNIIMVTDALNARLPL